MTDYCYICGALASSREHVPPQCIFPEGKDAGIDLRRNLVTVPSCEIHNQHKSHDDEYLLFALTMSITNNKTAMTQMQKKIVRSITRNPRRFHEFAKDPRRVFAVESGGPAIDTLMVRIDTKRFMTSLDWIARGLYRHHFSTRFIGKCSLLTDFILYAETPNAVRNNDLQYAATQYVRPHFDALVQEGENPDVFQYCFDKPDQNGLIAMRMTFFRGSRIYVTYHPEKAA